MFEIALVIRILTVVAQVVSELWDGPLGDLIRDLMKQK